MKQKLIYVLGSSKKFCLMHKKLFISVCGIGFISVIVLVFICNHIVGAYEKYILHQDEKKHIVVGLVLGSGITKDGKPYKELQARLDVAAQAMKNNQVDKLLLSGDNRFEYYDEPEAMKQYLINTWHISARKLQADYAGRSTYESCERAAKIFSVKETIIFSAGSHLPRAIFLCRHFGIQAYGISSQVEANNSSRREVLARVKAVYNVYIYGEGTLLGPTIEL